MSNQLNKPEGSGPNWLRIVVIGSVVGLALFVAGTFEFDQTHKHHLALWASVIALIADVAGVSIVAILYVRTRANTDPDDPFRGLATTGRTLQPRDTNLWTAAPLPTGGWTWKGGASVPMWIGRLNASSGLAALDLQPPNVTLRIGLGRLFGFRPLNYTTADGLLCFPVRGVLGTSGIALQPPQGRAAYFWTKAAREILSTLGWAGFRISWDERRARMIL